MTNEERREYVKYRIESARATKTATSHSIIRNQQALRKMDPE